MPCAKTRNVSGISYYTSNHACIDLDFRERHASANDMTNEPPVSVHSHMQIRDECLISFAISFLLGYYSDCKDAYDQGQRVSGVYKIRPEIVGSFEAFVSLPFDIYCDMDSDGGGWTVFQRRINGTENFFRSWTEYVSGFGDINGEHWLGLHKLYRLTVSSSHLRVDLADFDDILKYSKYTTFRVADSATKFRLTVTGYSGTAGDGLSYHNGRYFSTKDQDNDGTSSKHCAESLLGAWWYYNCAHSNLNGHYYMGPNTPDWKGVNWNSFRGGTYSLKATEMKVRRV